MRITLNYDIDKCPDAKEKAGWGCVGRFLQLFAAPAARPATGLAGFLRINFFIIRFFC
jgi:hypothetical protein